MVTSRGGEAQARRWVRWDVPRGGGVAPWRRRPRWGGVGGQGAAAGRWCVLRTPTQHQPVWLESHRGTRSESKMYSCTITFIQTCQQWRLPLWGGGGAGLACGGALRCWAATPRRGQPRLRRVPSWPRPARGCPGRGVREGHVQPTSKSNLTKRVTKCE